MFLGGVCFLETGSQKDLDVGIKETLKAIDRDMKFIRRLINKDRRYGKDSGENQTMRQERRGPFFKALRK